MRRADLLVKKFEDKDQTLDKITDEVLITEASKLVESIMVTVGDITLAKEPGSLKLAELLLRKKHIRELYENLRKEVLHVVGDDVKTAAILTSMAFRFVNQSEGAYDMETDHNVSNTIAKWRAEEALRRKINEQIKKDVDGTIVVSGEGATLPEEFFDKVSGGKSDRIKVDSDPKKKTDEEKEKPKQQIKSKAESHHNDKNKAKSKRKYTRKKKEPIKTEEPEKTEKIDEQVVDKTSANTFVEPLPKVEKTVRIPATDSLLRKLRDAENDPDSGFGFQEDTDWSMDRDEIVFSEEMFRHVMVKKFIEGDNDENDEVIVAATTSLED